MDTTILNLTNTFNKSLQDSRAKNDGLERLNSIVADVDLVMSGITKFLRELGFNNPEDEIDFYKNIKPKILATRIEEVLRYSIISNKPIGTVETQLGYFEGELKALHSFFRLNPFYYQYYRNKYIELDNHFFMRNAGSLSIPVTDMILSEEGFSPPMSYLFAKFLAYESVQYYILEQIAELQNPAKNSLVSHLVSPDLKWTGDSINIVELAYGLWLTGQLNNGNASLNQIVRWLEANLHVSIGIVQRRFDEIGRRKRLSPTRYIDQMRDNILKKIENENA